MVSLLWTQRKQETISNKVDTPLSTQPFHGANTRMRPSGPLTIPKTRVSVGRQGRGQDPALETFRRTREKAPEPHPNLVFRLLFPEAATTHAGSRVLS